MDGTYGTVGGTVEDPSDPFSTIAAAQAAIPADGFNWKIMIRPGTYLEDISPLAGRVVVYEGDGNDAVMVRSVTVILGTSALAECDFF